MKARLFFVVLLVHSFVQAQGFEMGPIMRNFDCNASLTHLKSGNNWIDSTFFYSPDTLSLPFFDDFSSDKFQQYNPQYNAPGVTSQLYYKLLDPATNNALPTSNSFTDQATFKRTFNVVTSTFVDTVFQTIAVKSGDFTQFPISYQTLNLYPPYYIYDTIGVPDVSDTVWVQNPNYIQDSARIFFATLNDPNALWLDHQVYRNERYAVQPRSLGVATFDGLNEHGYPYAIGTSQTNFADHLYSKPLDLSPYTAVDSLYFSFLVQPEGFGDIPESTDSLVLDFYAKDLDQWFHVWSMAGDTVAPFKVVHIPVTAAKYFKKGFQFRFRNYGALSGSLDHFHIDYVHLRTQSDVNDTLFKDFALVYPLTSLLESYTAVPWDHYKASTQNHMNTALPLVLHNGSPNPENNSIAGSISFGQNGSTLGAYVLNGASLSNGDLNYNALTTYTSYHDLSSGASFPTNLSGDEQVFRVKGTIGAQFPNLNQNDTTGFDQVFSNYYSYDDGSAEAAFGPTGVQSRLAISYESYEADSLIGISMHFLPSVIDVSNDLFLLSVWTNVNGHPGDLLYEDDVFFPRSPVYGDARNQFVNYFFADTQKVSVPTSFFVGWRQLDPHRLNLGLDRNIDRSDKIQYSVDGGVNWYISPFEGSAMLRPIFSTALDATLQLETQRTESTWSCAPNPATETLTIYCPENLKGQAVNVYSISGQQVLQAAASTLDISGLQPGIYFIQMPHSKLPTLKFVKQ
ncbi:MAG: hypothetical protein RLZZ301_782 [Bacteroidota bacterium]|jgi:hypothetical protein